MHDSFASTYLEWKNKKKENNTALDVRILKRHWGYSFIEAYIILVLYKGLLDILYVRWISKTYAYKGMTYSFDLLKVAVLWVLFLFVVIPFAIKHINCRKPSNKIIMFLELTYFIPGLTFLSYKKCDVRYLFFYFLLYFFLCLVNELKIKSYFSVSRNYALFCLFLFVLLGLSIVLKFRYNGFSIKMDLNDIYEIRAEFASANSSKLLSYMKGIVTVIIPVLAFVTLRKRQVLFTVFLVLMQLGMYSTSADKTSLFFLMICVLFGFMPEVNERIILVAFLSLILFSIIVCSLGYDPQYDVVTDKLVRRMMILPNRLSYDYYTFFLDHEHLFLRQTLFKAFNYTLPYDRNITYVIGEWNGDNSNANNGVVGDAYANFGIWALVVYPVMYGLFFRLFNLASKKLSNELIIICSLIVAIVFIDSSFFTSLITHGLIPLIVLMFLLPKTGRHCVKRF